MECRVAEHCADGKLGKEIAHALNITVYTVRQHRYHMAAKLGIQANTLDAVVAFRVALFYSEQMFQLGRLLCRVDLPKGS